MRKIHSDYVEEPTRTKKRSIAPMVVATFLLMLVSPVIYEAGLTCLAKWQTMLGTYTVPHTPILDALGDWWRSADHDFRSSASHTFIRGNWNPAIAVPIAIVWATAAALILRRTR